MAPSWKSVRIGQAKKLEQAVRRAAATGDELVISTELPNIATPSNTVSAAVIRAALSGADKPLHYRGLRIRGCHIEGDLDLSYLHWKGELRLESCRFSGDLILDYARLVGKIDLDGSHVRRVSAVNAVIDGSFMMRDGFKAEEGIYGIGLRVTGSLNCRRSHVTAPKEIHTRMAVELFGARLGDLFLSYATFDGGVYAAGVTIDRNVRLQASTFRSRETLGWQVDGPDFKGAFTFGGSQISGSIYISTKTSRGMFSVQGPASLRASSCRQIFIHLDVMKNANIDIEGMTYGRLRGITALEMLATLGESEEVQPQAYVQLAAFCQSIGEIAVRRKALMTLEKRLTRQLPKASLARVGRIAFGWLAGYGYQASRSLPWLALTVLAATWIVHDHGDFLLPKILQGQVAAQQKISLSWSESIGYTLDSFLPFASMGIKEQLATKMQSVNELPWLCAFLALKFTAWCLTALALASFTGVIRKAH